MKLVQRVCVVLLLPVPVGVFGDVLVDLGRRLGELDAFAKEPVVCEPRVEPPKQDIVEVFWLGAME